MAAFRPRSCGGYRLGPARGLAVGRRRRVAVGDLRARHRLRDAAPPPSGDARRRPVPPERGRGARAHRPPAQPSPRARARSCCSRSWRVASRAGACTAPYAVPETCRPSARAARIAILPVGTVDPLRRRRGREALPRLLRPPRHRGGRHRSAHHGVEREERAVDRRGAARRDAGLPQRRPALHHEHPLHRSHERRHLHDARGLALRVHGPRLGAPLRHHLHVANELVRNVDATTCARWSRRPSRSNTAASRR